MTPALQSSHGHICEAILALSRSIAGRTDLDALLLGRIRISLAELSGMTMSG